MTNGNMPLGHDSGPRENWFAKVQIMGGPDMNWQMTVDPLLLESFLRQRTASLAWRASKMINGETLIDFSYQWPPGFLDEYGDGELRVTPNTGIYLSRFTYGLTYDLLEEIILVHPENAHIVVAFEHFRALPYTPGLPRNEGISHLTEACDILLSKSLFPGEWRE